MNRQRKIKKRKQEFGNFQLFRDFFENNKSKDEYHSTRHYKLNQTQKSKNNRRIRV